MKDQIKELEKFMNNQTEETEKFADNRTNEMCYFMKGVIAK